MDANIDIKELVKKFNDIHDEINEYMNSELKHIDDMMAEAKDKISNSSSTDELLKRVTDGYRKYVDESESMYDQLEIYANQIISRGSEIMDKLGPEEYLYIVPLAQYTVNCIKKRREDCMKKRETFCMLMMMFNSMGYKL